VTPSYAIRRYLAWKIWGRTIPRETRKPRRWPKRDLKYRAWIRTFPCAACGSTREIEAAHTGDDGGISMNASDFSCVPLCAPCHQHGQDAYHRIGRRAFEQLNGIDFAKLATGFRERWESRTR
jgi:hypothetical protein